MQDGAFADEGDEKFLAALPLVEKTGLGLQRPGTDRALSLIESTRKQMLRAYRTSVHVPNADIAVLFRPVTTWEGIPDLLTRDLMSVLSANAAETCRYAPVGAAAVAAWRAVILSAICYRDGETSWDTLAQRAALTTQLCAWISSGGIAAALDRS